MMAMAFGFVHGAAQSMQTEAGSKGFCFHGPGVNLPIGYFLLIKKDDQVGALRILKITPDYHAQPRAGEWIGTVDYESYFSGSPKTPLAKGKKVSGTLHFGRIKGFGFHYSWQSGNEEAIVGPWKFRFFDQDGMFMTSVNFWDGINHDSGLQFAGTRARTVDRIVPSDPGLRWFGLDNNREIPCPVIPVEGN